MVKSRAAAEKKQAGRRSRETESGAHGLMKMRTAAEPMRESRRGGPDVIQLTFWRQPARIGTTGTADGQRRRRRFVGGWSSPRRQVRDRVKARIEAAMPNAA